jgi:fumarate hydratase class II
MKPVIAASLIESIELLAGVSRVFLRKCVSGIVAERGRCEELIERSLAMCTALVPEIGYDRAAEIAKKAFATGKTVREVAIETSGLTKAQIDAMLDPRSQTERGIPAGPVAGG